MLRVPTEKQKRHGLTQAMVDKLVIDEMWEFLSRLMTEKAKREANLAGRMFSHSELALKAQQKRKSSASTESSPMIVHYKTFLKKKAEGLGGRLPTVDENRQFYKEFQDLMRAASTASKRKKASTGDDRDWNPKKKIDKKKTPAGK